MRAHFSDVMAVAAGINLLKTIAPGTLTPLLFRSSSVTLFERSEMSGMPQKSVSEADLSTVLARVSAPSPAMLLKPTLRNKGHTRQVSAGLTARMGKLDGQLT